MKLLSLKNSIKLNPENSTLVIPISIGILFAILLFSTITMNLLKKQKNTNNLLKESEEKSLNIDKIEIEFIEISKKLEIAKKNKNDLISIVGGTKDLTTLLAKINKLSNSNFIKILSIKPDTIFKYRPVENKITPQGNNSSPINGPVYPGGSSNVPKLHQSSTNLNTANLKNDDLLVPNLEKHIVDIKVEANFEQLIDFLRQIELLENIILINDLKINRSQEVFKEIKSPIIIKMEISAHGKSIES